MIFNNKVYDVLKWTATVALPALASFVLVIGQIWGWTDLTVPIGATVAALATFLGALLGISSIQYQKKAELEKGGK
jgi:hypothetical protein